VPLVVESFNWQHGTFLGSVCSSETTAAAVGAVGVVRRDPFAMLPFCGYNMADYFQHWLAMGKLLGSKAPKIYYVNWFRKNEKGEFLWPGFGENIRVLKWMCERIGGTGEAAKTPVGFVPTEGALDVLGLSMEKKALSELLAVNKEEWKNEVEDHKRFYETFGAHLPPELWDEVSALQQRLTNL
jgi:phosphoenolpyruvate carboxykinase (GTP)